MIKSEKECVPLIADEDCLYFLRPASFFLEEVIEAFYPKDGGKPYDDEEYTQRDAR